MQNYLVLSVKILRATLSVVLDTLASYASTAVGPTYAVFDWKQMLNICPTLYVCVDRGREAEREPSDESTRRQHY